MLRCIREKKGNGKRETENGEEKNEEPMTIALLRILLEKVRTGV